MIDDRIQSRTGFAYGYLRAGAADAIRDLMDLLKMDLPIAVKAEIQHTMTRLQRDIFNAQNVFETGEMLADQEKETA